MGIGRWWSHPIVLALRADAPLAGLHRGALQLRELRPRLRLTLLGLDHLLLVEGSVLLRLLAGLLLFLQHPGHVIPAEDVGDLQPLLHLVLVGLSQLLVLRTHLLHLLLPHLLLLELAAHLLERLFEVLDHAVRRLARRDAGRPWVQVGLMGDLLVGPQLGLELRHLVPVLVNLPPQRAHLAVLNPLLHGRDLRSAGAGLQPRVLLKDHLHLFGDDAGHVLHLLVRQAGRGVVEVGDVARQALVGVLAVREGADLLAEVRDLLQILAANLVELVLQLGVKALVQLELGGQGLDLPLPTQARGDGLARVHALRNRVHHVCRVGDRAVNLQEGVDLLLKLFQPRGGFQHERQRLHHLAHEVLLLGI
mmetsp:Transcript_40687/g.105264  ORF Transcript_40687/g.105264 Transcript_40687/m.105264 type:complete len:364 (-) Transcript_40687:740-1831(-)